MKVAVVGAGVSGLGAVWAINEFSSHDVHLFEADSRPGGHANTVSYSAPNQRNPPSVQVDTGFIVFNPATYPNFIRFLKWASIPYLATEMTFSVSRDNGLFEWAGGNLLTFFCQPLNIFKLDMWLMLYDILRFNACCKRLLIDKNDEDLTIGQYLTRERFSRPFIDNYLIPMTAAVWSTPPDTCFENFPAITLVQFMHNHHLLQLVGKPSWLTVQGGSHCYIQRILSKLPPAKLHLSTPIDSVSTATTDGPRKLTLKSATETFEGFDHVILACHSDAALSILQSCGITAKEEAVLKIFEWNRNFVALHCDENLMPQRRLAWSCWNYLTKSAKDETGSDKANVNQVALTYCMNHLQHIPETVHGPVLVTLNPPFPPNPDLTVGSYEYDHPIISIKSLRAQREMDSIQNVRGISYAGAYLRYGFHEDGFTSGLRAAVFSLGCKLPFDIEYAERAPGTLRVATIFEFLQSFGISQLCFGFLGFFLQLCQPIIRTFAQK